MRGATERRQDHTRQLDAVVSGLDPAKVPRHVAIIMDGNGRWAQGRGLPRLAGHRAGLEHVRPILEAAAAYGVHVLTIYAFSTENWSRPRMEVMGLMRLFREAIDRETNNLHRDGVKVRHLGQTAGVSPHLARAIARMVETTRDNKRIILNLAFNYGGRAEILEAVRRLITDGVAAENVDEKLFSSSLFTAGQPDPDLIIRTAGEMRLSNFLTWQAAYAEYYVTPVYWPDFSKGDLEQALATYARRERRFGKV